MRLTRWLLIGTAGLAMTAIAVSCAKSHNRSRSSVEWPDGYSADVTFTDLHNPSQSYRGKMFVNAGVEPRGMRQDYVYPDRQRTTIFRGATGYIVAFDPNTRTYWKPRTKAELRAHIESAETGLYGPQKLLGTDNVDGRRANHFVVTQGENAGLEYWQDQKLRTAVKVLRPGISIYELTEIHEGRQPASLFEVPADYKEIPAPPAVAESN